MTEALYNEVVKNYGRYDGTRMIIKKFRGVKIPGTRKNFITKIRKGRYVIHNENGAVIATTRNMDI